MNSPFPPSRIAETDDTPVSQETCLANARIVLSDRVAHGRLTFDGDTIVSVEETPDVPTGAIDCDSDASTGMAIVQVAVLLVNSLQARDRPSCQPDRKSPGCTKGAVRREGDHERDNQHRERRGQVLEHHQLVA